MLFLVSAGPRLTAAQCVNGMAAGLYEELFTAIVSLINRFHGFRSLNQQTVKTLFMCENEQPQDIFINISISAQQRKNKTTKLSTFPDSPCSRSYLQLFSFYSLTRSNTTKSSQIQVNDDTCTRRSDILTFKISDRGEGEKKKLPSYLSSACVIVLLFYAKSSGFHN